MSAKIIDLTPYYGVISVRGQDALSFLQGQLTCDVRETPLDSLQLGGFCTQKGRLRALFKLFKQADVFYLELPKALLPSTLTVLKKYALFSKVQIHEETDIQLFGWLGHSPLDLQDILGPQDLNLTKNSDLTQIMHLKAPGQQSRFQLLGQSALMAPLWQRLIQQAIPSDINEWLVSDIRQGIPEIWLETTEQFFPHHLKLNHLGAISFTKGCYCGQEIIARMHYQGNIKRGIALGVFPNRSQALAPGSEMVIGENQNDIAKIVSAVSYDGQIEALLEIPLRLVSDLQHNQTMTVQVNSSEQEALIIKSSSN